MFDDNDDVDKMTGKEEGGDGFGTVGDGGRGTLEGEREGEKYDYEVLDRRCRRSPCTNSVKTNPLRMITEYGTEEWEAMYRKTGSKEREKRTDGPTIGHSGRRPPAPATVDDMIAQKMEKQIELRSEQIE